MSENFDQTEARLVKAGLAKYCSTEDLGRINECEMTMDEARPWLLRRHAEREAAAQRAAVDDAEAKRKQQRTDLFTKKYPALFDGGMTP